MQRIVNTIALLAAVITLGAGIWQDWGLLSTLKRVVLSYLGFFFLGAVLAMLMMIIPYFEQTEAPANEADKSAETVKTET
ncbi:hypothetical protein CSB20_09230 [bacterium DOLZORAL124_64_63]|nr:MAG: hypothetical protein CSB20_09230 [bacterium DOLZORAL124_64_63]